MLLNPDVNERNLGDYVRGAVKTTAILPLDMPPGIETKCTTSDNKLAFNLKCSRLRWNHQKLNCNTVTRPEMNTSNNDTRTRDGRHSVCECNSLLKGECVHFYGCQSKYPQVPNPKHTRHHASNCSPVPSFYSQFLDEHVSGTLDRVEIHNAINLCPSTVSTSNSMSKSK